MRARIILIAWVLAAQTVAPSLALASTARAGCCCASGHANRCRCPGCTKTRAREEGHGIIGGCARDDGKALPASLVVGTPVQGAARAAPSLPRRSPAPGLALPPPSPLEEVPTPPPRA